MKKRRRYRRIVRRKIVAVRDHNRHHLFYQRRFWRKHPWAYALRTHEFCIVELPIGIHNAIHSEIACVMLPNEAICERAVHMIDELWSFGAIGKDTPAELRLSILICILDGTASGTAYALKKQRQIILREPH